MRDLFSDLNNYVWPANSEMTYIVSGGALNSTHSPPQTSDMRQIW